MSLYIRNGVTNPDCLSSRERLKVKTLMTLAMALARMLGEKKYLAMYLALATSVTILYIFLLPTLPFGAFVPQAVRFITPPQLVFAFAFGWLLGLLITVNVYAREVGAKMSKVAPITSVVSSAVNVLCCTPVIPIALAIISGTVPVAAGLSPSVQFFFERYYFVFYVFSTATLVYAVYRMLSNLACCEPPSLGRRSQDA
jgi:hypothetical protein